MAPTAGKLEDSLRLCNEDQSTKTRVGRAGRALEAEPIMSSRPTIHRQGPQADHHYLRQRRSGPKRKMCLSERRMNFPLLSSVSKHCRQSFSSLPMSAFIQDLNSAVTKHFQRPSISVSSVFAIVFLCLLTESSANQGIQAARAESQARLLASLPRQPRHREGFSIEPRSCSVSGEPGTCMFVWECLKTDGKHLGMCMDGFMFGSCCVHPEEENTISDRDKEIYEKIDVINQNELDESEGDGVRDYFGNIPKDKWAKTQTRTTTTPTSITTDMIANPSRPTRPPRPTKSSVKWPHFQAKPTKATKKPLLATKAPVNWHWDTTERAPYFPAASSSEREPDYEDISQEETTQENEILLDHDTAATEWTSLKVRPDRPTRPPRPPKPSSSGYFPSSSGSYEVTEDYFKTASTELTVSTTPSWRRRPTRAPLPPKTVPTSLSTTTTSTTTTSTTTTRTTTTTTTTTTATTSTTTRKITTTSTATTTATATTTRAPRLPAALSENNVCGVPEVKGCPKGRIVNGTQSCYGQFPWQVSVRRTSFFGFTSTHRCGGALINEYWVATAGHCVDDLQIPKIRVRIGEWDFSSTGEKHPHVERKVTKKIVHPKYNFFTYENDLALVRVEKKIHFQDNIIPICLPGNNDLLIGETGIVAGWGRLSEGGQLPNILQYVSVPIVSNAKCKSMFLRAGRQEVIPDIFMCAGYDNGGQDSCQGDSGGPLVVKGKDGRWFLGGIISWGIGCAEPNLPGVCTRISQFREWLLENAT